jgi:tetratricopeptide (TPR) repeat protein
MEETDLSAFCVREDFLQVHLWDGLCELPLGLLLVAQSPFEGNFFDENIFHGPFPERVLGLSEGFSAWFEEQRTGPIIPHSRDICSLNLAHSLFVLLPLPRSVFLCTQFVEQNTDCVYTWLYLSQIILSHGFSSDLLKIRIGVPRGMFPALDLQMARIYLSVGDYSETLRRLKEISEGCVLPQHIDRFSDVATLAYRLTIELIHTPARPEGIPEIDELFFESHLRRLFDVAVETLTSTAMLFDSDLEDESMGRWGPRGTEVVRHLKEVKASTWSTKLYLPQDVSRALVPLNTVSFVQRKWLSILREHCKTIAANEVGPTLLLVGLTSMQSMGTEIALPWPSLYDYQFTNEVVAKARAYPLGVIILLRAIHTAYGIEAARRFWISCIRAAALLSRYELNIQSQRIWGELATAAQDDSLSEIIDSLLQEECVKEPLILFQICVRRMKYHEATEVLKQVLLDDVYEIGLGFTLWDATVSSAWKRFNVQSILRVLHTNKKGFALEVLPLEVKKALCSMYEPDNINLPQIHGFLGQYSEGIELLKDIVGWEELRALKTRVELLTANQMYDKAIEECNQALSHAVDWYKKERKEQSHLLLSDDFESTVLYYKASVLNAEGNGKETIEICDHACRRRPDPRFAHLFRGIMKRWLTDDQFCHLVPEYARSFVFLLDNAECLLYGLNDHEFLLNEKFIYFA